MGDCRDAGFSRGEIVWVVFWLAVAVGMVGAIYVPLIAWVVTRGW